MVRPRLAVSVGDVNGIGVECFVKAVLADAGTEADLTVVANPGVLRQTIATLRLPTSLDGDVWTIGRHRVTIESLDVEVDVCPGRMARDAGAHAVASLERATRCAIDGAADALLTLPISKEACHLAGFAFPGQTEFLADRTGAPSLMVLCTDTVRVALATVHIPIRRVADAITVDSVVERCVSFHHHLLHDVGCSSPRIAVLGLNPHAGEHGHIGTEDEQIIAPAIERLQVLGFDVDGPWPADGFFGFGHYRSVDGILAMYHDQGLVPLKLLAGGGGVNVTAGLPIVRTSPDHGTAFGLAGRNAAEGRSTAQAMTMAIAIARRRAGDAVV